MTLAIHWPHPPSENVDPWPQGPGDRQPESQSFAPNRSPIVTRLLSESGAAGAHLAVLAGGKDRLLPVREAAERLGLCTATVYGLCAEGALPYIRILNAIRIAPGDLEPFVAALRRS